MPPTRLDRLISEVAKGQMMILVGTGVSVYSTGVAPCASWKGLLTEGIDYSLEWANPKPTEAKVTQQRGRLAKSGLDHLLCVATEVESALGGPTGGLLREFLKGTVGELTATHHQMLGGIKALHEAGALIATTNYDGLLEDALDLPAVPWFARFTALQIIRLLQFTESYLPDGGPTVHSCFPTLPLVPRWLVDLIPTHSALGDLVFKEDQLLLARVGDSETSYESLVLPRYRGELLHRSGAVGADDLYYTWVVPQWIHYRFERPLPNITRWRVWVLTDDRGRECYMTLDKRPWSQE